MDCFSLLTEITCSALSAIENGIIIYSNDTTTPYVLGTQATYGCDEGYELDGGNKRRVCIRRNSTSTGYWNGTAPSCSGNNYIVTCSSCKKIS